MGVAILCKPFRLRKLYHRHINPLVNLAGYADGGGSVEFSAEIDYKKREGLP
jgi:hypothetical protein